MKKLHHTGSYYAVNSLFPQNITSPQKWYQWVVKNILESWELWYTTAEYLYQYEKWKQSKPFWIYLWNNKIQKAFPIQQKPFYSWIVSQIIQEKNAKK